MPSTIASDPIVAGIAASARPAETGRIAGVTSLTNSWDLLNRVGVHLPRVLIWGPPGTGKTYVATTAGLLPGQGTARVVFTEDTPAAELRGHYIPAGNEWAWHDGPVITCYRYGGRFVADEITRAADDALSFMLGVLDGLPLTLPTGETVSPHPQFSVWATTNDDPSALSDALADRFVVRVKADKVNPAALATLPPDVAHAVSTGAGGITMREGAEFARLYPLTGPRVAGKLIWGDRSDDVLFGMHLASTVDG